MTQQVETLVEGIVITMDPDRRYMLLDGAGRQVAVLKQMDLVLADFVWSQLLGRTSEMRRESLDDPDVRPCCILGVITALEFLQHHLSESGHKDLLPRNSTSRGGQG